MSKNTTLGVQASSLSSAIYLLCMYQAACSEVDFAEAITILEQALGGLAGEAEPTYDPEEERAGATRQADIYENDPVHHPRHYTSHPSGIEAIDVAREMGFNLVNVVKYVWRAGLKDKAATVQDLEKARWYLNDEIERLKRKDL